MKLAIRRLLNLLLYLSFCVMIGTGLLMAYRLVPGSLGGQGLEVLRWDRHQWGDLHRWISYLFVALMLVHLALNWNWLVKCAAKGHPWRLGAGLLAGAAIVGTLLFLPVTKREGGRGRQHGSSSAVSAKAEWILVSSPATENVTFEKDIRPILDASCVSCHGPKKQKAGFRADRRADLFRDEGDGPLVLPGNSSGSRLLAIVTGAQKMKRNAKDHVLSAAEVALIRTWIDAGAE
jgi:mono/diheme cytochrome c family protein